MAVLDSNKTIKFWERYNDAVTRFRRKGPRRGDEEAFNSAINKMQKAGRDRDLESATGMMRQITEGHKQRAN